MLASLLGMPFIHLFFLDIHSLRPSSNLASPVNQAQTSQAEIILLTLYSHGTLLSHNE